MSRGFRMRNPIGRCLVAILRDRAGRPDAREGVARADMGTPCRIGQDASAEAFPLIAPWRRCDIGPLSFCHVTVERAHRRGGAGIEEAALEKRGGIPSRFTPPPRPRRPRPWQGKPNRRNEAAHFQPPAQRCHERLLDRRTVMTGRLRLICPGRDMRQFID
jgi:hypothetical protein